jgi:uncharacterized membrane protein
MESNQEREFRRIRQTALGIFVAFVTGVATLIALSIAFGRFPTPVYPPFFFFFGGWWILIPLFLFGFFFFFRWWGWGYWWGNRGYYYDYDLALETLRQRFARGEITSEQYEEMKRNLGA